MAFDSLSNKLNKALRDISGKGRLTEKNMEDKGCSQGSKDGTAGSGR